MIDSHCHVNFNAFKDDWREVINRCFEQGITAMINIGSNYKTSERAINIAKEYNQSFAAVGLHPIHVHPVRNADQIFIEGSKSELAYNSNGVSSVNFAEISNGVNDEKFEIEKYQELIKENKDYVKAIGETGLDYYHTEISNLKSKISKPQLETQNFKEMQEKVFLEHLKLAREFSLPLILHCRGDVNNPLEAYNDLLSIIHNSKFIIPGVIHCFSANWEIAQKFLALGFYIGFTGIVTYKNCGRDLLEVVEKTLLEKILIETDSPYLTPEPHRGERCEPWYVKFTAQRIAEIKKITPEKVIEQTTQNAKELFKI